MFTIARAWSGPVQSLSPPYLPAASCIGSYLVTIMSRGRVFVRSAIKTPQLWLVSLPLDQPQEIIQKFPHADKYSFRMGVWVSTVCLPWAGAAFLCIAVPCAHITSASEY